MRIISFLIILLLYCSNSIANMNMSGMTASGFSYSLNDRIFPIGDSITLGLTDTPVLFGYRDHLQDNLGIGNYNFVGPYTDPDTNATYDVDHGGLSGQRTAAVLARISADLLTYMPLPNSANSKILLFIGTNDSSGATPGFPPPPVDPAVATANVVSIVNTIVTYDPNINIYVALITPHRGNGSVKNNPNFIAYNAALGPAILSINSSNPKVHLVNMYNAYVNDTFSLLSGSYLTTAYSDDTHPNDLGYTVIARQWASCIQSPLNTNCDGH